MSEPARGRIRTNGMLGPDPELTSPKTQSRRRTTTASVTSSAEIGEVSSPTRLENLPSSIRTVQSSADGVVTETRDCSAVPLTILSNLQSKTSTVPSTKAVEVSTSTARRCAAAAVKFANVQPTKRTRGVAPVTCTPSPVSGRTTSTPTNWADPPPMTADIITKTLIPPLSQSATSLFSMKKVSTFSTVKALTLSAVLAPTPSFRTKLQRNTKTSK
mmetsp:Transcript_1745/g.4757  ORF Transcript_1745/g.4757 Transcript_1745/m.4757 type:complete len:216 (-) Transcript_1745:285-932(-)